MAKHLKLEHALPLTKYFLEQMYQTSITSVLSYLSRDIIWVDADMQYFYGYHQVFSHLQSTVPSRPCNISQFHCRLTTSGHTTAIITGQYTIHSNYFCLIAVWTLEHNQLNLLHLHISPSIPHDRSGQMLTLSGRHSEHYYVSPDEIIYIEADNTACQLHSVFRTLYITLPLKQLAATLPGYFLRIHRSFIINSHHVKRVGRYEAELSDGTVLPIPEKKYMWLLCQLELSNRSD